MKMLIGKDDVAVLDITVKYEHIIKHEDVNRKGREMKWKENIFLNNIFVSWRNMNKKWFYGKTENLEPRVISPGSHETLERQL